MSPTTTPGRGYSVPSIDTQQRDDKSHAFSMNDFPLTPPQSANDYRRPSLAYSLLSEPSHSGPSSISGYSQPSTPVHNMPPSQDLTQRWLSYPNMNSISANVSNGCTMEQLSQPMFGMSISPQAYSSTGQDNFTSYPPATPDSHMPSFGVHDSPMQENWAYQRSAISAGNAQGLTATLFQSAHGLGQEAIQHTSGYGYQASAIPGGVASSMLANHGSTWGSESSVVQQRPSVVIPSQLSPYEEDHHMDHYADLPQHQQNHNAFNSFDSAGAWDLVDPSSPVDAYMGPPDDDDYVPIKAQPLECPWSSSLTQRFLPVGYPPRRTSTKRSSRRGSKSQTRDKVWHKHKTGNIDVCCSGKKFRKIDGKVVTDDPREPKPHKCQHRFEDGNVCGQGFARSEHLKRHMGSHSKERQFWCPLDSCDKRIGRSDNASQHFKTHLAPAKKGKRNDHCDIETLERAIFRKWEEKQAIKTVHGLRKYMETPEMQQAARDGLL